MVQNLQKKIKPSTHVTTVVCPPYIDIPAVFDKVEPDTLKIGAQNIHEQDEGNYTGEISGPMLKGLADYVIVGHSERRRDEAETDLKIAAKLAAAVRNNLTPVLCVGERLNDREDGHSSRVVADQLRVCLSELTATEARKIIITYEPVWAISDGDGKGHFATPDKVKPMLKVIRETVEELFSEATSSEIELLYGGSANPDNAAAFLKMEHINGLLVGGASLNYESFAKIVNIAEKLTKE